MALEIEYPGKGRHRKDVYLDTKQMEGMQVQLKQLNSITPVPDYVR
jgi:hypothetical protein